jgi:Rad9
VIEQPTTTIMDIVIPAHSIRNFSAALAALSKMGMDVYWEYDSISGLSLRTINDAKSSYAHWRYKSTFFERCGYTVRKKNKNKKLQPQQQPKRPRRNRNDDDEANDDANNDDEKVSYRIASRTLTAIVRYRKAASLRIQETADGNALSFEFGIEQQSAPTKNHQNKQQQRGGGGGVVVLTVIHEIPMVDAESMCTVVDDLNDASELVATPQVYSSLLDALPTSVYAALIVRQNSSVSASSFSLLDYYGTTSTGTPAGGGGGVTSSNEKKALKSETACDLDEFLDYDFVGNRDTMVNMDDDDDDDDDNHHPPSSIPEDVNQEVILVFHLKEPKLFLQFCQTQQVPAVRWSFHWGGKPLVLTAEADTYRAELVMATLDHEKLTSMRTMENNNHSQRRRPSSSTTTTAPPPPPPPEPDQEQQNNNVENN